MNIESQVCSLELSKKLNELGVKQRSLFYWIRCKTCESIDVYVLIYITDMFSSFTEFKEIYSAFTVAELGEMLFQKNYDNLEETGYLNIVTEMINRSKGYLYRLTNNLTEHIIDELNEANARAKMLIYLIENNLFKQV